MTCPLYTDFTRTCIEEYPELTKIASFYFCESNIHDLCIIYRAITFQTKCGFLKQCIIDYLQDNPVFIKRLLTDIAVAEIGEKFGKKYCYSPQNLQECARYICYQQEKKPPAELFADGHIRNLDDFQQMKQAKKILI